MSCGLNMHSVILSIAAALLSAASLMDLGVAQVNTVIVVALAMGVIAIGLPHGALDYHFGRRLFGWLPGGGSSAVFFIAYLALMGLVVLGWYLFPVITVLGFFALAAWHFGEEEEEHHGSSNRNWLSFLAMVARGGMVIWIPVAFQTESVRQLLLTITPVASEPIVDQIIGMVLLATLPLAALTIVDLITHRPARSRDDRPATSGGHAGSQIWLHSLRVVSFAAMFATVHPLISFGVYFCGWHSIRGLVHLQQEFGGSWKRFVLNLAPMSLLAALLFGLGFAIFQSRQEVSPAVLRTVFIGLSAVAVPHLCLHLLLEWFPMDEQPEPTGTTS